MINDAHYDKPAGYILPFDGGIVPEDWLEPYGQMLNRCDYPDLYMAFLCIPELMDLVIDEKSFTLPIIPNHIMKVTTKCLKLL